MLGPMTHTPGRAEATDFSAPYDVNYVSLMTWKPVKFVDPFNFLHSFSLEVWLGVFFSWTLLAFATARLDALVNRMTGRPDEGSFAGFFWVYFKLMFPNTYPSNRATWFRLLMGVWLLALVVLMGLLNCTLTSTMLVRKTTDYVDNFEDLMSFCHLDLKNPVGETFKKLSSRHEQVVGIYQAGPVLDSVMQQVLKKERVMFGTSLMLKSHIADNFVRTGECKHHVTRGTAGIVHIMMLVRKSLPREFKEKLDR
ncbi:glutamate receptor ionotropic, NMDA 2A-like [Ixodes scapularis]